MQAIKNKLFYKICGHGRGWSFTANDFVREFDRSQIDNALSDLVKENKIRRVCRGLYDFPKYSELLSQYLSPNFDQVAQAFARKFNWRIQPTGETALNLLALSTQVPGRYTYLSDGPHRSYAVGLYTLEFKKTALKEVGFKYRQSGIIVQALKSLGKNQVSSEVLQKIRQQLAADMRQKILKDTITVTGWVYDAIKQICREEQNG